MLKILLLMLTMSSASYAGSPWGDYLMSEVFSKKGLDSFFTDADDLIKNWSLNLEFVDGKERTPQQSGEVALACKNQKLYPTHPQQTTKDYLFAVWSGYNHGKLDPKSSACLRTNPSKRMCVRADIANIVVMSDIYEDTCGNLYRGYWLTTFLKGDESQGTLVSKGRAFYIDPDGSNFRLGGTYAVNASDFLFLGRLLKNDRASVKRDQAEALRLGMKLKGKLYIEKSQGHL